MPATIRNLRPLLVAALGLSGGVARAFDADQVLVYNVGNLTIKPQLDQSTQYSDNIFYGNDSLFAPGTTIPLRAQEDDLILMFSPGVLLQYGLQTGNRVTLEYTLDDVVYTGHSDFNTLQHRIDLRSQFEAGKFRLTGDDSVNFLSSFMGGGYYADPNNPGANRLQVDRTQTQLSHRLLFDYSDKSDAYGDFLYNATDFTSNTSLYDINNLRGTLGATYKYSDKLGIFAEGFYGQSAVNPNQGGVKGPHSDVYGGFVGVQGEFTPKLSGSLKVGYEQRAFPNATLAADSPAVEVSLSYVPTPLTRLVLAYSRRTSTSLQFVQQTYVFDAVTFTVNQQIGTTGKWGVSASARYDRGEFDALNFPTTVNLFHPADSSVERVPAQVVYPTRNDNNITLSAGVSYQPRPWWTITLGYEFERFDSDAVYFVSRLSNGDILQAPSKYLVDYDAHRVLLKLSFGY